MKLRQLKQQEQQEEGAVDPMFKRIDLASLQRRQEIYDIIKDRQRDQKEQGKGSSANYKGVVREEELFDYDTNAFMSVFNKFF